MVAVAVILGLLRLSPSARLDGTQGLCFDGEAGCDTSAPLALALFRFLCPHLVTLATEPRYHLYPPSEGRRSASAYSVVKVLLFASFMVAQNVLKFINRMNLYFHHNQRDSDSG